MQELLNTQLSDSALKVISYIFQSNFFLTLVGGGTRDFLLNGQLSSDLDFELRSNRKFSEDQWKKEVENLYQSLKKKFETQFELTWYPEFCIITMSSNEWDLEFSSPRTEKFVQESAHHKNFDPFFDPQLDYNDSFKRRDLTLNSIGYEWKAPQTGKWVDPFQGRLHIEQKLLIPTSEDFCKDPVRFLRAIRFHVKMGFSISPELKKAMAKTNLAELTLHYLEKEILKSKSSYNFLSVLHEHIQNKDDLGDVLTIFKNVKMATPITEQEKKYFNLLEIEEALIPGLFLWLVQDKGVSEVHSKSFRVRPKLAGNLKKVCNYIKNNTLDHVSSVWPSNSAQDRLYEVVHLLEHLRQTSVAELYLQTFYADKGEIFKLQERFSHFKAEQSLDLSKVDPRDRAKFIFYQFLLSLRE